MPHPGYPYAPAPSGRPTTAPRRRHDSHSAFAPARKPNGLVCCPPPTCHFLALCTGGLSNLFDEISTNSQSPLHDFGSFTTENGRFKPSKDMPLLALRYRFVKILAEGQSCVVVQASDTFRCGVRVSIKVLHLNYCKLGTQEVEVIRQLNLADPYRFSGVLKLQNTFMFDDHFCMVFDYYDPKTLLEHVKAISDDKAKLEFIRKVAARLVLCLAFLQSQNVIHADLKIENILLADPSDPNSVRLVDFGNAIHCVHNEMSLYYQDFELQTLLYRAPEVMYGLPFGTEVDLWSLGTVLAQLYIGHPFVMGKSKQAVTADTVKTLGPLPKSIFQRGKFYRTLEQFTGDAVQSDPVYRLMAKLSSTNYHFCDFLSGLLQYDPKRRMTPQKAASHPFLAPILGFGHFSGRYPVVPLSNSSYPYSPLIQDDIKRQQLSSIDLLRRGSTIVPKVEVVESAAKTNLAVKRDRIDLLRKRHKIVTGDPPKVEVKKEEEAVDLVVSKASTSQTDSEAYTSVSDSSLPSNEYDSSPKSDISRTAMVKGEDSVGVSQRPTVQPRTEEKIPRRRDENFNLKRRSPRDQTPTSTSARTLKTTKNVSTDSGRAVKSEKLSNVRKSRTPEYRKTNGRYHRASHSDEDSDDTALLSPDTRTSSVSAADTVKRASSVTSVTSGPADYSSAKRDRLEAPPAPSRGHPNEPPADAHLRKAHLPALARSTPMLKQNYHKHKTIPDFGDLSPIGMNPGRMDIPSSRCKKTLPFHTHAQELKTQTKRKRSTGAHHDLAKQRRMGDKSQLLYDVFGEDVYRFRESPHKS